MAKIKGSVDSIVPKVPQKFENKIQMIATHSLTENEAYIFYAALKGVSDQLILEKVSDRYIRQLIIVLTKDGSYCVEDDFSMGSIGTFAVFSVQIWRDKQWSDLQIFTCFLEELCHHFFSIEDEEEVKYKVLEIANNTLQGSFSFEDLYDENWKKGYPHIYKED